MSAEPLDGADGCDAPGGLEFLDVGLTGEEALLLRDRLIRENGSNIAAIVADAWLYGATAARNALQGRRVCRVCGCWEHGACLDEHGGGCSWIAPNLCSACDPVDGPPLQLFLPARQEPPP